MQLPPVGNRRIEARAVDNRMDIERAQLLGVTYQPRTRGVELRTLGLQGNDLTSSAMLTWHDITFCSSHKCFLAISSNLPYKETLQQLF